MAIGDLVKQLRQEKSWSVDEAVRYSGVCRRTWQQIEYHDEANLTVRTIKKLAQAFGVEPEVIFRALI